MARRGAASRGGNRPGADDGPRVQTAREVHALLQKQMRAVQRDPTLRPTERGRLLARLAKLTMEAANEVEVAVRVQRQEQRAQQWEAMMPSPFLDLSGAAASKAGVEGDDDDDEAEEEGEATEEED